MRFSGDLELLSDPACVCAQELRRRSAALIFTIPTCEKLSIVNCASRITRALGSTTVATVFTPDGEMTIDETKITRIISPHQGEPYTHIWGPAGRGAIPVMRPPAPVLVAGLRLPFPLVKFSTCAGPNVPVWVSGPMTSLIRSPTAFEKAGQHPPPNAIIIVGGLPQPILETVPAAITALNGAGGHLLAAPPASAGFAAEVNELFVAPGHGKTNFDRIWD